MKYKYMFRFLLALLLMFTCGHSFAQLSISVPSHGDTTICPGQTVTLRANLPTTTPISLSIDDGYSDVVPIGFPFKFYGTVYTSCVISSNGYITFDTLEAGGFSDWSILSGTPYNLAIENSFCGVYSDIYPALGGTITYSNIGTAPNRVFIATFCACPMFSCTTQLISFQMMMYETSNKMEVHIGHKELCTDWNGGYAIEGLENADMTTGAVVSGRNYPFTWTATHDGKRFTPDSTFSVYTVSTVPYSPVPVEGTVVNWYDSTGTVFLGSGDTLNVSPTVQTTYIAQAITCSDTIQAHVHVFMGHTPAIDGFTTTNPTVCGACDGTILLHGVAPGHVDTFSWSFNGTPQPSIADSASTDSTVLLTGLCPGTYDNFVVKIGYCSSDPAGPVSLINPPFNISEVTYTNPGCAACDGSLTVHGLTPGQIITLNYNKDGVPQTPVITTSGADGTITLDSMCEGTYDNIIAYLNTCSAGPAGPVTLSQPPPIAITSSSSTNPLTCGACNGTITLTGVTPLSIDSVFMNKDGAPQPVMLVSASPDGTIIISGLCKGTYDNILIKVGPCPTTVSGPFTLTDPPIVPGFTFDTTRLGCHGDTVLFTNTSTSPGTLYYNWQFGDGGSDTATNPTYIYLHQGVYAATLYVTNLVCHDSISETVTLLHPIEASFHLSPDTICQGHSITFTNASVGTGASYVWNFGDGGADTTTSPSHTFVNSGVYSVSLIEKDYVPCYDTAMQTVFVDTISGVDFSVDDTVICQGQQISFAGFFALEGNIGYTWDFGDGYVTSDVNPITHTYVSTGHIPVTLKANYRACPDTSITKYVNVHAYPAIYIGADTSLCPGNAPIVVIDSVNAGNPLAHWVWSTGDTTAGISINTPGYYYATVTIDGCPNTDSIWVKNDCYMNIPNIFTPNNDGVNDYFFPRQLLSEGVTSFTMDIYNRWGQLVFQTTNTDGRGWDGKLNNTDQPEGVYVYMIDVTFKTGVKEHHQGNVTLLR